MRYSSGDVKPRQFRLAEGEQHDNPNRHDTHSYPSHEILYEARATFSVLRNPRNSGSAGLAIFMSIW